MTAHTYNVGVICSLDPNCAALDAECNAEWDEEFTEFTTGALLLCGVDPKLVTEDFPTLTLPTKLDPELSTQMTFTELDLDFAAGSEFDLGPFTSAAGELVPETGAPFPPRALSTVCGCGSEFAVVRASPKFVTEWEPEDAADTGASLDAWFWPAPATGFVDEIATGTFLAEFPTELKSDSVAEALPVGAVAGTDKAEKSWLRMEGGADRRCLCRRRADVRLLL